MGCGLWLDDKHVGVWVVLEPRNYVATLVDRDLTVDNVVADAVLVERSLEQLYSVCEGYEHQHLVARLFDHLKNNVQPVANVELNDLASIRIDRTTADLE